VIAALALCAAAQAPVADYTVEKKAELTGHTGPIHSLAFSRDGKLLASSAYDGPVRVWDVAKAKTLRVLDHDKGTGAGFVYALTFTRDGRFLLTLTAEDVLRKWDARGGVLLGTAKLTRPARENKSGEWHPTAHHAAPRACLSPDGRILYAEIVHGLVLVDVATLKVIATPPDVEEFSPREVQEPAALAVYPDGKRFVTGTRKGDLLVREAPGGKALLTVQAHKYRISDVAVNPDGTLIASGGFVGPGGGDGMVKLWDATTGEAVRELATGVFPNAFEFAPKGPLFAFVGGSMGVPQLWNASTGQQVWRGDTLGEQSGADVAFNHDATLLAGGGKDQKVVLWTIAAKAPPGEPPGGKK
jgi:WD40 repeat protein